MGSQKWQLKRTHSFPLLDCPEEVASFLGSPGLMVTGRVEPALGGVVITIATEEDGLVSTNTDEQGRYR